ncbi:MAG: RICIN domain-containing protein, partial [Clostridia bacterium]|nr:RICIN domain-containing protein [Clostridia bacterium]
MKKHITAFAVALFLCILAGFALSPAMAMESAVAAEYGPWSAWTQEPIEPAADLEIDRELINIVTDEFKWTYSRYVYYDGENDKWYSADSYETVNVEGGRWEEKTFDAPLEDLGGVYAGGWYNERVSSSQVSQQVYQYRSRVVRRVTCEISTDEILILPEKSYKLEVNFFDGSQSNTYQSSDLTVASVDQSGNVLGVGVGAAQITVSSSAGRTVVVDVYVCETGMTLPEGVYTFRQLGTDKAMTVGKRISSRSDNITVSAFTGNKNQRFTITNLSASTFTIHPLSQKSWYLDIARNGNNLQAGANVQIHSRKDRTSQYFRAIYVPDGSYIFYPRAQVSLSIGVEPEQAGSNVRLETLSDLNVADRWIPIRTTQSTSDAAFIRPVAQNGISYVLNDFGSDTRYSNGIFFGSNSRRVFVLSSANGKVLSVKTGCDHD